jgi:hypothetical protein
MAGTANPMISRQRNPNRPAASRLNIDIGELRRQVGVIFGRRILRHQVAVRNPVAAAAAAAGRKKWAEL